MAAFADLNILYLPEKEALQKLVEAAAHLGYSTVAINYVVDYEEKKKEIVKPLSPTELFPALPLVQGKSKPIKILSRLTLVVSDPSHCNVLRATSTNIKYYDIFAVFPRNAKLFHVACTTLDVDLVCVDVTEKLPFFIKRPSVNVAIERGVYFELIYVPAIKDSTMRRYTISNAFSLMQICRGKNIILSSAAEKPLQLRSPYDVANLGWLFGLSESNAKAAVSTNGRAVILHGEARKTASGVVYTMRKPQTPEDDDDSAPLSKKAKTDLGSTSSPL
ncbi:ribonuclease P protein subunit p30 isoform X1 [Python bivittatus]|uniref:Ribonuclease P protein subunit p30 n=1 Tax=Python bivittatus TaxID=176946 RepID=A0A9F2NHN1_PYTBI|nr:ribonuclease P protein subunit p30 isoform X1 [Python bivittatus]